MVTVTHSARLMYLSPFIVISLISIFLIRTSIYWLYQTHNTPNIHTNYILLFMYGYYGHGGYYDDLSQLFGLTFNDSQIVKFKVFKIHMFSLAFTFSQPR